MQIHHLEVARNEHYVVDPELGVVRRQEQAIRQSSTTAIVHQGKQYKVEPDGSFDVPDEVGRFFLRLPNWHGGPSPFSTDPRPEDSPPTVTTTVTRKGRAKAAAE